MIYGILILGIISIFILAFKLFKKPKFKYNYIDMVKYNKSIQGTDKKPLPVPSDQNELNMLLSIIAANQDDDAVLNILIDIYEQLIVVKNGLDVLILSLSELLYNNANNAKDRKEARDMHRASRITRRLAHSLYRKYQSKGFCHSNPKFLQFID